LVWTLKTAYLLDQVPRAAGPQLDALAASKTYDAGSPQREKKKGNGANADPWREKKKKKKLSRCQK